jgi:hypothetical protein
MGHRPSSLSQRRPMLIPVCRLHITRSGLCLDIVLMRNCQDCCAGCYIERSSVLICHGEDAGKFENHKNLIGVRH